VGAQFWSVYVPVEMEGADAVKATLEQIDVVTRMAARHPETFELATTADEIERIHRSGRIASLIGVEGGHSIDGSLAVLRQLHRLGARYMTLTHWKGHAWADAATSPARHGGLSDFGREVVREMNRLGMLVDLSHVSVETMDDALRISTAPVIASHSSCHALAPHPRNVPDAILRKIADNGGVVMVNFYSGYLLPEGAEIVAESADVRRELRARHGDDVEAYRAAMRAWRDQHPIPSGTIHDMVDHIDHVVAVAGIDHVGLGSDYDGVGQLPGQLEDVSSYPRITQVLLDRGYSEAEVRKVLGLNALRALREAERVASGG
jgi:membrane dipeptidase